MTEQILRRVPSYLNLSTAVSDDFIDMFRRAEYTFQHQIVYDPVNRCRIPLTPIERPAVTGA